MKRRKIERQGYCRSCGFTLEKGSDILYTYSNRGRGVTVILCIPCAKLTGDLANQPED